MKFRFDAAESDQLPSRDRRSGDVPSRFTNYFKRTTRTVLISAIKKNGFRIGSEYPIRLKLHFCRIRMRGKHAMSQSVAWKREFPHFFTNNPRNHFDNQKIRERAGITGILSRRRYR
ncbi:hypothetical protein [Burkholderia ubonensis]|uniref:hypothetical protein n=1 Tax=Burkholderia ubonensis TaxID=101571 RepID=UPI000AA5FFF3|nr:hypothetical protein [Burkholderia ubonensis]